MIFLSHSHRILIRRRKCPWSYRWRLPGSLSVLALECTCLYLLDLTCPRLTHPLNPLLQFWLQLLFGGAVQLLHLWVPETKASILTTRIAKEKRVKGEEVYSTHELEQHKWEIKAILQIMSRPVSLECTGPMKSRMLTDFCTLFTVHHVRNRADCPLPFASFRILRCPHLHFP